MKKTPTLKKLKQRITGKKNRTDLAKTSNTAKRLSSGPIFTLDYIEYQLSEWGLETPDPLCHFSLSVTHEDLVQPIPCSILTEPALQRRQPSLPGDHLDQLWGALAASFQVAH